MNEKFDKVINRKNTTSVKWSKSVLEETFGSSEVLPLWVADMDFKVPEVIQKKVQEVADFGIYGYSATNQHIIAFIKWIEDSFSWTLDPSWILNTPGVVNALGLAVQTFTQPGDSILIQRPVYYPFTDIITENGRKVISNTLINKKGRYEIDFADFEEKVAHPNTRMFMLCSPHNPISRVWTAEELDRMMQICQKYDVLVISDEIHNDLIMPDYTHTPVGNLSEKYSKNLITCMAPSKTFNLAGMQLSNIIIEDTTIRERFKKSMSQLGLGGMNPFALEATTAAYSEGRIWLNETIEYIYENYKFVTKQMEKIEGVTITDLEATYLMWIDFRDVKALANENIEEFFIQKAKVALDGGHWFGPEGEGFMRLNLAAPREIIEEAVERIIKAIEKNDRE